DGDLRELAAAAHTLKSPARTVGALALGHACERLESVCRAGDEAAMRLQWPQVRAAAAAAAAALQAHLAPVAARQAAGSAIGPEPPRGSGGA
ncbi:MAG: Hpt domain-containing protein, partial [Burkholderiales bacterium]|nr:Hpt domain-containing protein [Burkholderiales bacterium]